MVKNLIGYCMGILLFKDSPHMNGFCEYAKVFFLFFQSSSTQKECFRSPKVVFFKNKLQREIILKRHLCIFVWKVRSQPF